MSVSGTQLAEIDAEPLIELRQRDDRAVQIDRLVISGIADDADHALAFAEIVGADQMRAIGLGGHRAEKLFDFVLGFLVAEDGQRERRFGDEDVARHEFERRARRIARALVVAGDDGAPACPFDDDLRRAENMTGGHETHADAIDR